ncbi:hypothetical protein RB653_008968 [Dictyostelium firmibasis]|uniref:Acyl-CoA synthetase family member 3, mitochondrial n=1 Tax=Dictyostelium firmibasis TaxID=79012 RepID=A0AAN7TSD0_9MYCE
MNRIPSLKLFNRALKFKDRTSIINYPNNSTQRYTYNDLLNESQSIANILNYKKKDLEQERIAYFFGQNFDYVRSQWGIWAAGGTAVPLAISHPIHELQYTIENSKSSMILTNSENYSKMKEIGTKLNIPVIELPKVGEYTTTATQFNPTEQYKQYSIDSNRNALIIYTSGTTSRPKGVVTTHANIEAQIQTLVDYWKWTEKDHILEVLPLHHVHGVINVVSCALWSGAICEMMPKFDCKQVIDRLLESGITSDLEQPISLFMAVPTIYSKLIKYVNETITDPTERLAIESAFKRLRLMVSGSSALPESVRNEFQKISGQVLLERYGMTEIGMALSNPLNVDQRIGGTVGFPLPGVQIKIQSEPNNNINNNNEVGELLVKGPQVFKEYFEKKEATKEAFDEDGWFKTGDIVEKDLSTGRLKILGRSSVDIIKRGGFKISALEIEREILDMDSNIQECAILGIPNDEYGQDIGAIIVYKKGKKPMTFEEFKTNCKVRLAHYKVPNKFLVLENEIPKNAMSKVNKKELLKLFS